ncbi:polysaccharide lyase family 8 super-sandwich domain-containing protein [Paenibacillus paeoniae]|uniref:Hyaluronate lyase n=1 Tax=Paenibacillus paeoniae TaxID=2292705 RepID=A0A371P6T7_9BACL|nr:polysaccharide lyase family 8 super-sandwich domain-containing protein [Paenibacillus paeoniae]REK71639.1 hyaluronate lyase [Paenibacillus paeoniae]
MRSWLRYAACILLSIALMTAGLPAKEQSLVSASAGDVQNGSFETAQAASGYWTGLQPAFWSHWVPAGAPALSLDSTVFYEGTRSLKISSVATARADVLQTVEVTPGENYTLRGWIKTEALQSGLSYGGAFIRTQYLNSANVKISDGPSSVPIKGTTAWSEQTLQLVIPANVTRVKIELFYESATGSAWFDAISISTGTIQPPVDPSLFQALRDKRLLQLTGNGRYQPADMDMNAAIMAVANRVSNSSASGYWDTLNKQSGRSFLWSDLSSTAESSHVTGAYGRLKEMALAYATEGSPLRGNETLLQDLIHALDWMNVNRYNETTSVYKNWWDWEIGSPQHLNDIVVLLFDRLTSVQVGNYNRAIDRFVPDPSRRTVQPALQESGANLADKSFVVVLRGATGLSAAKLNQGRDALSPVFRYVTQGDGFYRDGSFVQHGYIAYTGSYGTVLLDRLADMFDLLHQSPWMPTDPQAGNVYRWIEDSFEPLMVKGAMMDMVRGRATSRESSTDHTTGRGAIRSILRLAQAAPVIEGDRMKSAAKSWLLQDTSFDNYYVGLSVYDIDIIKGLLQDQAVLPRAELSKYHVFAGMDRIVHSRPGFAMGISMSSNRIASYEYGNGENKKPWHTGNGMTYLYNDDLLQYSDGYWATADMLRLPGTTTDHAQAPLADWNYYFSSKPWVGGASLEGLYGAAGMELDMQNSTLTGKKSWFFFDNEIVALGTGITGGDGRKVETIVENRKVQSGGQALTVNGVAQPAQAGWNSALSDVNWAHLSGDGKGDIGYYFPRPAQLQGMREARTGTWSEVNNGGSTIPVTREYVSLAFQHGVNPNIGFYSYVLLPNADAATTQSYSESPDITVLSNGTSVQSVREHTLGITAINYWASAVVDGIASKQPASVVVKETDTELVIAVADPTQRQSAIAMELNRTGWTLASADSTVTVQQVSPSIKLTVNVAGAKGGTHTIRFTK